MARRDEFVVDVGPEWIAASWCPHNHVTQYRHRETGRYWHPLSDSNGSLLCVLCIARATGLRCNRPHLIGFTLDEPE